MEYIKDTQVRKGRMSVFRAKTQSQMMLFGIFIYLEALKRSVRNLIALVFWVFKVNKKLRCFALREKLEMVWKFCTAKKFSRSLENTDFISKDRTMPRIRAQDLQNHMNENSNAS